MIKNDRQLEVGRAKRAVLEDAIAASQSEDDRAPLESLLEELQSELDDYCGVRDGHVIKFAFESLEDLAENAIRARIARRLTQKDLADRLGVSEQSIQRSESSSYEGVGIARLADVLDALGYRVRGVVTPLEETQGPSVAQMSVPIVSAASSTVLLGKASTVVHNESSAFGQNERSTDFTSCLFRELQPRPSSQHSFGSIRDGWSSSSDFHLEVLSSSPGMS